MTLWSLFRSKDSKESFNSLKPPSPVQVAQLAKPLSLAGKPLQAPEFVETGWRPGQTFTADQDPDRIRLLWEAPSFVQKDPVQQRQKTRVEDLISDTPETFARVVHGVVDEEDCAELIRCINVKGFTPALLNIGRGRQRLEMGVRNGHRCIVDSQELSSWLLEVLRPYLPETLQGGPLVDFNERCRMLCYTPGQEFSAHYDACFERKRGEGRVKGVDCSLVTAQLYLHDVPAANGGGTAFLTEDGKKVTSCQPGAGSVLLFTQNLLHEGSLVTAGIKYTLRTEAMYRLSWFN